MAQNNSAPYFMDPYDFGQEVNKREKEIKVYNKLIDEDINHNLKDRKSPILPDPTTLYLYQIVDNDNNNYPRINSSSNLFNKSSLNQNTPIRFSELRRTPVRGISINRSYEQPKEPDHYSGVRAEEMIIKPNQNSNNHNLNNNNNLNDTLNNNPAREEPYNRNGENNRNYKESPLTKTPNGRIVNQSKFYEPLYPGVQRRHYPNLHNNGNFFNKVPIEMRDKYRLMEQGLIGSGPYSLRTIDYYTVPEEELNERDRERRIYQVRGPQRNQRYEYKEDQDDRLRKSGRMVMSPLRNLGNSVSYIPKQSFSQRNYDGNNYGDERSFQIGDNEEGYKYGGDKFDGCGYK